MWTGRMTGIPQPADTCVRALTAAAAAAADGKAFRRLRILRWETTVWERPAVREKLCELSSEPLVQPGP